jgi:hypothetical protein
MRRPLKTFLFELPIVLFHVGEPFRPLEVGNS